MNKKGFTLLELLAVIVILAIIALITIPQIIGVIDKSKKSAFIDSAYGIIEAGKLYYMDNMSGKDASPRYDFKISEGAFVLEGNTKEKLKFSGSIPDTGILQLHSNGNIAIGICNKDYCACKSASELKVSLKEGNCNINSETGEIGSEDTVTSIRLKELEEKVELLTKKSVLSGTVISYMGSKTPDGYLACDGKVYNISDYSSLANTIKDEFGSYNYFGGDGTTTFAVPDLRGEFLRGTGTNSHANSGSGTNVGKHQDATMMPAYTHNYGGSLSIYGDSTSGVSISATNMDSRWKKGTLYATRINSDTNFTSSTEMVYNVYTTRPTNTSVLYAIKY